MRHLPGTLAEALPFYRALIERHHAAMLEGDAATAMQLRGEAERLATKNNYEPGILAGPNVPGNLLDRKTRAKAGRVPLWGQRGTFEITCGCNAR